MKRLVDRKGILFFLLLPYFKPGSLQYIFPEGETLLNILRIVAAIIAVILYTKYIVLKKKKKWFCFFCCLWQFAFAISTLINGKDIRILMVQATTIITFCMLVEVCIHENAQIFFYSLFYLLFVFIIINFILLIQYPNGIAVAEYYYYPVNFLGIDNLLSPILIIAIVCSFLFMWYGGNKVLAYILSIVSLVTAIITWSATGIVSMIALILLLIFTCELLWRKVLNPFWTYIGIMIINIMIIFMNIQTLFANFITGFLGKNLSLSGRTEMWKQAVNMISQRWLLGYGNSTGHGFVFWRGKFYYTHNGILEILMQGGIIALTLFVVMIVVQAMKLYKYRTNRVEAVLLAGSIANMVGLLAEAYITQVPIYALMVFGYNVDQIIRQMGECCEKRNNLRITVLLPKIRIVGKKK